MPFSVKANILQFGLGIGLLALSPFHAQAWDGESLNDIAQDVVKTLDHDVVVFHWDSLPTPTTSYIPPDDPSGLKDVKDRIRNGVWDPAARQTFRGESDWMGYGFYAAIDPVVSANYGKPNAMDSSDDDSFPTAGVWRLIALTLPAGTKYLEPDETKLSKAALKELALSSCSPYDLQNLFSENDVEEESCRAPMRKLFSDLGIGALAYGWGAGNFKGICKLPPTAFYVTDQAIAQSQVTLLTSALPPSGQDSASSLRLMINSLWAMATSKYKPWPTLGPDEDKKSLKKWAQSNLFGCD